MSSKRSEYLEGTADLYSRCPILQYVCSSLLFADQKMDGIMDFFGKGWGLGCLRGLEKIWKIIDCIIFLGKDLTFKFFTTPKHQKFLEPSTHFSSLFDFQSP